MVIKAGKFGLFLACSAYPECENTRELETPEASAEGEIEEVCENCGKPMAMKRGRFGQFLACTGYPECKTTRKVIATKGGLTAAKPDQILDEKCPKCSSNLVIKQGRFGEFTACTNYPTCKYVKQKSTGVLCPKDGGDVVERKSRRGKVFFGCANYPDCDFVLWNRPVAEKCPDCGAAVPRREDHEAARPPADLQQRGVLLRALRGAGPGVTESLSSKRSRARARARFRQRQFPCDFTSSAAAWRAAKRRGRRRRSACRSSFTRCGPSAATAVHKTDQLAELVCSNSFRGDKLDNAVGLLKEEMRRLGSVVMRAADASRVPAGAALAVDRDRFSSEVTRLVSSHPLHLDSCAKRFRAFHAALDGPVIVATGPLTSPSLSADIAALVGADHLYFYDAISPIVLAESIDRSKVFRASRWGREPARCGDPPESPDRRRAGGSGLRRSDDGRRRLPELPVHRRGVRAVLRRADGRREGARCTSSTRRSSSKAACRSR